MAKYQGGSYSKTELAAFAEAGIRNRVREIERELHRIQRSFPKLLLSAEPVVLLAPEPRTDGQTWPPLVTETPKPKRSLSAKALTAMRTNAIKARLARRKQQRSKQPAKPVWQQMQAFLLTAPDHRATAKTLVAAMGTRFAAIANSATAHPETFKRVEPGVYTLTAAAKNGANV